MRVFKTVLCVFSLVMMLVGCQNTVKGFGQDMQRSGEEIQKSV